ncbi:unnamed protein product [Cuscuta epithymum]|uniref:DDE Tnp4 domain-containing protein n=1 Tax=Cuscuta epithymum TaxID=186058 RepID=A0AAV0ESY2_9ASTE|nr:unnamed protein product [Cuscuta epithymum]
MSRNGSGDDISDSASDEDDESGALLLMTTSVLVDVEKIPCRTSILTGNAYIDELMTGHPLRCYENFRMKPHVFLHLCERLKNLDVLHDSRYLRAGEQLGIGLLVLCLGVGQHTCAERFQHSMRTVHLCVKRVVRALARLAKEVIKPINRGPVQPEIIEKPKWYLYFEKCVGAIDGTHVAASAPASKQKTFRGRHSTVTQNVMAACSHDMLFTYVYAGWEGTCNDSRVFLDAITRSENGLPMPPSGYYYVVDAGYPNVPGLAPYRGESYHLKDFRGRGRIRNKQALFNYGHSSVHNVIERCFGVLKERFPILDISRGYPLRRQVQIPIACCALHNFIRMQDRNNDLFLEYEEDDMIFNTEASTSEN